MSRASFTILDCHYSGLYVFPLSVWLAISSDQLQLSSAMHVIGNPYGFEVFSSSIVPQGSMRWSIEKLSVSELFYWIRAIGKLLVRKKNHVIFHILKYKL